MKVLVALPVQHSSHQSIDSIVNGQAPCSGTDGSIIRLAALLADAGIEVCLSAASPIASSSFPCIEHVAVKPEQFDYLIVHQSHWNGISLTFGNHVVEKTFLWLQNHISPSLIYTFLCEGGYKVVCPSTDHANLYRGLPGWSKKVVVIYNSHSSIFRAEPSEQVGEIAKPRLLFVGAITPAKGFIELTQIWSYLAQRQVVLDLAIAGSIGLHSSAVATGTTGLAELGFETEVIQPWLNALPDSHRPKFLGSLSPFQLRDEMTRSWAVIVNPSYREPETFCVSAVEAQACNRTVFSVKWGALSETVYQGKFNSLGQGMPAESVGERIIEGLNNRNLVIENGRLAGGFVRQKFSNQLIAHAWLDALNGIEPSPGLSKSWSSGRDFTYDLMRWSGTWSLINRYRKANHRQLVSVYRQSKKTQHPYSK